MNQAPNDRLYQLYRHAFQLLEEQIAIYIKEHYSGVSKIEFSPIFIDGDGQFTMLTLKVVPVIYDNDGNRALFSRKIENFHPGSYGLRGGISTLRFDGFGNDAIRLSSSATGEEINVSKYDHLPDEAKLSSHSSIDRNIRLLVEDGQIKGVEKDVLGSPQAEIIYNLEIQRGEYWEWD
ncbi:hypothetical protein [Streptococcus dentiloxodontae]